MSELPKPVTTVENPDLRALLNQMGQELMTRINCAQIGEIVSFDGDKQTAQVQLKVMRLLPDRTASPPVYVPKLCPLLIDVPVFILCGGTGRLTFPIVAGDPCFVVFNDRDIDNWFKTGGNYPPNSVRTHDLSDGFAFVGFRNLANKFTDFNTDDAELRYAGGLLKVNDKLAINGLDATLRSVLEKCKAALTKLDGKTGPSAATEIAAFGTEYDNLLQ